MQIERLVLVLLAAGAGKRFGGGKLRAPLGGRPLVAHAAETLATLPFLARTAVVGDDDFGLATLGYRLARAPKEPPLSASISAGVAASRAHAPDAIMIALSDMPFVPAAHIVKLVVAFDGDRIASTSGAAPTPPAIFGARWFGKLGALEGDAGARALLKDAPTVFAHARELMDIDTHEQLREADAAARGAAPPTP